jgi:hypothetical protein
MGPKKQGFWPRINCNVRSEKKNTKLISVILHLVFFFFGTDFSQMKLPDLESPSDDSFSKSANFGLSK